jgi:hypothetical protein
MEMFRMGFSMFDVEVISEVGLQGVARALDDGQNPDPVFETLANMTEEKCGLRVRGIGRVKLVADELDWYADANQYEIAAIIDTYDRDIAVPLAEEQFLKARTARALSQKLTCRIFQFESGDD